MARMRWLAAALWLASRALVVGLLVGPHSWVTGDVGYFSSSLGQVTRSGLGHVLVEYPLPAVGLLALPRLVADVLGHPGSYGVLFVAMAAVTDVTFTVLLYARRPASRPYGLGLWLLAVPLLGATCYSRFDLVPGVLVGAALLLLVTRPRAAAALLALATALKLWPILIVPAVAARMTSRWAVIRTVAGIGVLLAGSSVLLAGWARLVSPLIWQSGRGLQVESVLATPAMIGWLGGGPFTVRYTSHNAYEIFGPGVGALLLASTVATALFIVALGVLWWRAWLLKDLITPRCVCWLTLSTVSGFMVSGKVLSPQYLLWLLPAAAAALTVTRVDARLLGWCVALLIATGLTQLVFPMLYAGLIGHTSASRAAVVALVLRNVVLVALTMYAGWAATRELGSAGQRGNPLDRQPPGPKGYDAVRLR